MSQDTKYNPPWMKVLNGEKLTFSEWFQFYISAPLSAYRMSCKITPELRERCVRYAIDGGAHRGSRDHTPILLRVARLQPRPTFP